MKHILQMTSLLCLVLLLPACGISQKEYDSLLNENKRLEEEVNTLSSQIQSLSKENSSLSSQVESLLEYKTNQVLNSMDETYGKAWATTAFGDNTICFTDDTKLYFQCIPEKKYAISSDGISILWSDVLESATLLGTMQATYPDKITYETISIKFFDLSGTYILDVIFKRTENTYSLDSIACNVLYADTIASALILSGNNQ